jgi:long-chain acyl-CoA synthetase
MMREGVARMTLGWRHLGIDKGDRIALLSENRPEWVITDHSLMAVGAATVPIYTSLTAPQIEYILANSEARAIVVSTADLLSRILAVKDNLPHLRYIVLMDDHESPGLSVMGWRELMKTGARLLINDPDAFERLARAARENDLASIIYTSGTTGPPKGVMLTHRNFVSNVLASQAVLHFHHTDRALSFLPLSHVFERTVEYVYLHCGVSIVHVDLEDVAACLPAMKPTVFCSVPRLFEKVKERVEARVASSPALRQKLFHWAKSVGRQVNYAPLVGEDRPGFGLKMKYLLADKLILSKVRAALGGRLRFAVSGGAPFSGITMEFFTSMGIMLIEGYGLTETSPVIAANSPARLYPGTVGPPLPDVEVRIAEDGEILTRGPGVMKGYFKNPEATAKVMDGDWFRTGDIGKLDDNGCLSITDRKKDLIVTSGGKNIAPQVIEAAIKSTGIISQAVVIGDRRKFISALIVPDPAAMERIAEKTGQLGPGAADNPAVQEAFMKAIDEATKEFAGYERVKKIRILTRDFSIEEGDLTPTMKVRRRAVEEKYKELIESMYREEALPE